MYCGHLAVCVSTHRVIPVAFCNKSCRVVIKRLSQCCRTIHGTLSWTELSQFVLNNSIPLFGYWSRQTDIIQVQNVVQGHDTALRQLSAGIMSNTYQCSVQNLTFILCDSYIIRNCISFNARDILNLLAALKRVFRSFPVKFRFRRSVKSVQLRHRSPPIVKQSWNASITNSHIMVLA